MAVENREQTPDQQINEMKARENEKSEFLSAFKDSDFLNNTLDLADAPKEDENVDAQDQTQEEPEQDEQQPELETPEQGETKDEDEFEDVIPKSKVQPRIDKLASERDYWKNQALSRQKETQAKATDELTQKLEAMTETELDTLKEQARDAWLDAKIKGESDKAQQYRDLEKKAEKAIATAPQRFAAKQASYYNQAVQEINATGEFKDTDAPEILKLAREIYSQEPDLQNDIKGQGLALKAAAREYRATLRLSQRAKENPKLKSQLNTLKKATSLDGKTGKAVQSDTSIAAGLLRKSKNTGLTEREKSSLVMNDPRFNLDSIIPSHLKG